MTCERGPNYSGTAQAEARKGELHRSLLDALKLRGADKIERSTQPVSDRPANVQQQSLQMWHQLIGIVISCRVPRRAQARDGATRSCVH
jgi:hypothetical protein